MIFKNYIDKQGEDAIRNFKYKGGSSGISYTYLWSPFAEYVLKYVPITWAPNAITLAGFLLVVLAEITIYGFGHLGEDISSLRILIFAICIFTYQTLDNIDGKQSRRTKTSTPLGMLFDHGCDSMSCFFLANTMCRIISVTDERLILVGTLLGIMFSFYFSVWAQYHSGGIMHLGKVNAVDDGIPAIWMLALFTIYKGMDFWRVNTLFGIPINTFMVFTIIGSGFRKKYYPLNTYVLFLITYIVQIASLMFNTGENFTKDLKGALKHFIHLIYLTLSLVCICVYTDWWHEDRFFNPLLFSLGFMYVRNITYMQLCVTTSQEYNQFTTANKVFSIAYPAYILLMKTVDIQHIIPESLFIYGLLAFFFVNYLHFAVSVVVHMSDILGIKPFSIMDQLKRQGMFGGQKKQ